MVKQLCFYVFLIVVMNSFGQHARIGKNQTWVNQDYKNCLRDSLPCECSPYDWHNFMTYDIGETTLIYLLGAYIVKNYHQSDTVSFHLHSRNDLVKKINDRPIKEIKIINDTLYMCDIESNKRRIYEKTDRRFKIENSPCLNYLDSTLRKNGYRSLEKILNSGDLSCDCDPQFGINRIIKDDNRIFVFQRQGKKLLLYRWNYPKEIGMRARYTLKRKFKLKQP